MQIKAPIEQCLHCGGSCPVPDDKWKFTCLGCGWVNDLMWEGVISAGWESPPIEILPGDAYKKTVPFQVAYPPFYVEEFRRLSESQQAKIKEIVAKQRLSDDDFEFLKHARHGVEKIGDPWKFSVVKYGAQTAISVPEVLLKMHILKPGDSYTVYLGDKRIPHCTIKQYEKTNVLPLGVKIAPGEYDGWIVRE
jgi:antitoxin component of MazEF toxin-antitoxin module